MNKTITTTKYLGILQWKIEVVIRETRGSDAGQFENISSKVNTVQWGKISSNYYNSESNLPEDIKNWIVASNIDLLSVMESFSSPKRRVWVLRESFLSNIRLSVSLILLMKVNSTKFPQLHKGFIASTKLCQILCSLRWLKPIESS